MISTLIMLIVYLIIAGIVWWAAREIIAIIPMDERIKRVVNVLLIVLIALIILYALTPLIGHIPRLG